jgi:hypothetical protein
MLRGVQAARRMSRTTSENATSSSIVGLMFDGFGLEGDGMGRSSIFPGGLKVQCHTLSRWFANVEIKVRLFVAFGGLFSAACTIYVE